MFFKVGHHANHIIYVTRARSFDLLGSKPASTYVKPANPTLMFNSSARPYLHMLGLPNPTSCERRLICVTPDMYGMLAIWEILPGGAHFGRILVFGFVKGSSYHMLPSCILYWQVLRCLSYGNTKSTVSPFEFVLS